MAQRKEFLTAAEVMERLRLGRTTVYQQARLFLATGGAEGIPCRRYGRSLRFPAAELEAMTGDPHAITPAAAKADDLAEARAHKPARPPVARIRSTRRPTRRTPRRRSDAAQATLPLGDRRRCPRSIPDERASTTDKCPPAAGHASGTGNRPDAAGDDHPRQLLRGLGALLHALPR